MSDKKPLLLKICLFDFKNSSRNYRELSAAEEAGFQVMVLADVLNSPEESGSIDKEHGFDVYRFSYAPKSNLNFIKKLFSYIKIIIKWTKKTASFNADVISCHDIYALLIGYLSNMFKRKSQKAELVYDSHEFEIGRAGTRKYFQSLFIINLERFLIKKCVLNIMVTDSIADEVMRIHKLSVRPLVIRSTPLNWVIDNSIIKKRRKEYIKMVNTEIEPFFVMYHGAIIEDRGIEKLIKIASINHNIIMIIMGYTLDKKYFNSLKSIVNNYNIANRVIFLPAVPLENLWEFVGAADIGIVIGNSESKSHKYGLPNKFFENIQSLTPFLSPNFYEFNKITEDYDIGLTFDSDNIEEINECIERTRTDKELYAKFKKNLFVAKEELCWENEKLKLIEAYKRLI